MSACIYVWRKKGTNVHTSTWTALMEVLVIRSVRRGLWSTADRGCVWCGDESVFVWFVCEGRRRLCGKWGLVALLVVVWGVGGSSEGIGVCGAMGSMGLLSLSLPTYLPQMLTTDNPTSWQAHFSLSPETHSHTKEGHTPQSAELMMEWRGREGRGECMLMNIKDGTTSGSPSTSSRWMQETTCMNVHWLRQKVWGGAIFLFNIDMRWKVLLQLIWKVF